MVDPNIRLQNIALEHAELLGRRSMSWAESTNRTTMFMSILGAAVVGLALFAQTGVAGGSIALLALVLMSVVLLVGLTTLLRIGELDEHDMRWIQGLNRLRSLRLELDPGLAPYLVTSPHDDFKSVLEAYAVAGASPAYAFGTLLALLVTVNAVLAGVVGGLVAANLAADAVTVVAVAIAAAIGFLVATGLAMYRSVRAFPARLVSLVPAPLRSADGSSGTSEAGPSVSTD
jgi:hypothetical protein